MLNNASPTRTQLVQAALRYAGAGAIVTGHDALQLHGAQTLHPGGPVHLLISHDRQVRSDHTVQIERSERLPRPLMRQGFLVAPLHRAVIDATRRMKNLDSVRAILTTVVQRAHVSPADLSRELAHCSSRGTAVPRRVLTEIEIGIRSPAEAWARNLVSASGLPAPRWNVTVRTQDGGVLLGIADAWWDSVCMAWEIDSVEFHTKPSDYARTMQKHSAMAAAGIYVVHTLPSRLQREPRLVLDELRRTYQQAAARPRPQVIAEKP